MGACRGLAALPGASARGAGASKAVGAEAWDTLCLDGSSAPRGQRASEARAPVRSAMARSVSTYPMAWRRFTRRSSMTTRVPSVPVLLHQALWTEVNWPAGRLLGRGV